MMENISVVTMFTLSGLDWTLEQRIVLFLLTLLWYLIILLGNFTLIFCIILDKNLHEPMYVFLCNLCINAVYGTSGFYPKFLVDLLSPHVISYAGCMLQGFVIHSSGSGDFSILAVMAYDRYVAICRPLVYHSFMTRQRVCIFVFFSWFIPLYCMFMNTASLLGSRLCGSHINRIYCVNWMVAKLACSPPKAHTAVGYVNIFFYFVIFICIILSYMYLIRACRSSKENMGKFMQTCLPHLISLIIYTITLLCDLLYMRFGSAEVSGDLYNFMAINFLLLPPMLNPVIYGLKLTKIQKTFLKFVLIKKNDAKCQPVKLHVQLNIHNTNIGGC